MDVRNCRVADADAREFGHCISFSSLVLVRGRGLAHAFSDFRKVPCRLGVRAGQAHTPHPVSSGSLDFSL